MNPTVTAALLTVAGVIVGALASFWIQSRKLPSDIRLTDAQAEKAQHEAASMVIENLSREVERLKQKLGELEARLTKAEARATGSEARLAEAETRASEFRRAVIAIGERLDRERAKARDMAVTLVGIIDHLLSCIEDPSRATTIDRPAITKLTQSILDGYQPEQFVRV